MKLCKPNTMSMLPSLELCDTSVVLHLYWVRQLFLFDKNLGSKTACQHYPLRIIHTFYLSVLFLLPVNWLLNMLIRNFYFLLSPYLFIIVGVHSTTKFDSWMFVNCTLQQCFLVVMEQVTKFRVGSIPGMA